MNGEPVARRDGFTTFLSVACFALAVLVVLLAIQNRRLKAELAEAAAHPAMPANALKAGDRVGPIALVSGRSSDAAAVAFDGASPRTLLFVFSSTCPACRETFPIWNDLVKWASPDVRVVAIQTDFASGEAPDAVVTFPIHGFAPGGSELSGKIPYVPTTALIDADGIVADVWFGVPSEAQQAAMRATVSPTSGAR